MEVTLSEQPPVIQDRFNRTVCRIAAEAFWLRTYQAAIEGMRVEAIGLDFFRVSLNALRDARLIRLMRVLENDSQTASFWYLLRSNEQLIEGAAKEAEGMRVEAIGLDFFRVSLNALRDARLIRLMRVLENDSQTASFWYLLRSNEQLIEGAAKEADLDLSVLRDVAGKLRGIRNKTFVHIDKEGVFDPQQYYKDSFFFLSAWSRTSFGRLSFCPKKSRLIYRLTAHRAVPIASPRVSLA